MRLILGVLCVGIFLAASGIAGNPPPVCDFDGDGTCDIIDIDLLLYEGIAPGTNDPTYDLNADAVVDLADRDVWLDDAGILNLGVPYVTGDVNFDGFVDASDLMQLGLNWQINDVQSWSQADFNADSWVNVHDLNEIGINWQHGRQRAAKSVPEPNGLQLAFVLLALAAIGPSLRNVARRMRTHINE